VGVFFETIIFKRVPIFSSAKNEVSLVKEMKHPFIIRYTLFSALIFLGLGSAFGQSKYLNDSMLNAQQQIKTADSFIKLQQRYRLEFAQKQKDSIIVARKQFRADSIYQAKVNKLLVKKERAEGKGRDYKPTKAEKVLLKALAKKEKDSLDQIDAFEKKIAKQNERREKDSLNNMIESERKIQKIKQQKLKDSALAQKQTKNEQKERLKNEANSLKNATKIQQQIIKDSTRLAQKRKREHDALLADSIKKVQKEQLQNEKNEVHETVVAPKKMDTIFVIADSMNDRIGLIRVANKRKTYLSFQFGLSNYLGDLGGQSGVGKSFLKDVTFNKRTFFYGVGISRHLHDALGFRFNYTYGEIAGGDQTIRFKNKNDAAYYRFKRNLDFQSTISEFSLLIELYPQCMLPMLSALRSSSLQSYLLLGVGHFSFNPKGLFYDEIAEENILVDLAPLHLEGQGTSQYPNRKPYALSQMNIPFGFGCRYQLGSKSFLSFEFVGRKLFTDYLDDVSTTYVDPAIFSGYLDEENLLRAKYLSDKSLLVNPDESYKAGDQRGNEKRNDFYYSFNLKLSVLISRARKLRKLN
jgi:hypothetical protein